MRVTIVAVVLVLGCAPAAVADGRFAAVSAAMRQLVADGEVPSIAAAAARDGRILWEDACGWADHERAVPATPQTPYSLASISKPFTATAVMQLVESGRLALDRPANDYLGDARIAGSQVERATVRRLLSHTAGLATFYRQFDGAPPSMDEIIAQHALLTAPPGRRYVYSNLGYGILERIIERVSGRSYEDVLRRGIFVPLGLQAASVPDVPSEREARRYGAGARPLPFYTLGHRGASSVYASAHDLALFGIAHLDPRREEAAARILSPRSLAEMQRVQTPGLPGAGYGLGWRIEENRSRLRQVGHTGGMPGVTTVLSLYPSERTVVVVLTNTRSPAALRVARQIAAHLMPLHARDLAPAE